MLAIISLSFSFSLFLDACPLITFFVADAAIVDIFSELRLPALLFRLFRRPPFDAEVDQAF